MFIILAMIEPDLALQKPLEDYVENIDKLNKRSILLCSRMFSPLISFSDPHVNIQGDDNAQRILQNRFSLYPDAKYKIVDFMWGRREASAYIYWSFIYTPKKLFSGSSVDVVSNNVDIICEVKFLPDGSIYSHAEFWGEHENFDVKNYKRLVLAK